MRDLAADTTPAASTNRKLNLIYLANEVSQQSRAKKRNEYPDAFGQVIPGAVEHILRHVPADVQGKIRRVVDVWRQRAVFSPDVLLRLNGVVKETAIGSGAAAVAAKPVQATPAALRQLTTSYQTLDELMASMSLSAGTTDILLGMADEATADIDPKLDQVVASIDNVEKLMRSAAAARDEVISHLRSLLEVNEAARADQQDQAAAWVAKREAVEERRRTLSTTPDMDPPPAEALTPTDPAKLLETSMESDLAALLAKHAPPADSQSTIQAQQVAGGEEEEEYVP